MTRLDIIERQNRILIGHLTLPQESVWRGAPTVIWNAAPGDDIFSRSCLCREEDFAQPYFSYWTRVLGEPLRFHRKLWEYVFICQALAERGMLAPGKRGLGFGVGQEPLPAFFSGRGCEIVGTDMGAQDALTLGWTQTAQHAAGLSTLKRPELCPPDIFERNASFETVDMNAVPDHLTGFDFCWSACALEHLGSIEKGLAFIERSVQTLKPGGFAVHTTEYNLSSERDTLDNMETVLFRQKDMQDLSHRLESAGHRVVPFNFDPGLGEVDRYLDVAPYRDEPHLKLMLEGFLITSIGLIVQRGPT